MPLNIFVQKMVTATDSYPLLAIPFFVLAGAIMNKAGHHAAGCWRWPTRWSAT